MIHCFDSLVTPPRRLSTPNHPPPIQIYGHFVHMKKNLPSLGWIIRYLIVVKEFFFAFIRILLSTLGLLKNLFSFLPNHPKISNITPLFQEFFFIYRIIGDSVVEWSECSQQGGPQFPDHALYIANRLI